VTIHLDTSVVLAATLQDEGIHDHARAAVLALRHHGHFHAADILPQELTNGLSRVVRRGRLDAAAARRALDFWLDQPWTWHPVFPHCATALNDCATGHGHAYDLLHLHTAHAQGARLLTADQAFIASAHRHPQRRTVLLLDEAKTLAVLKK